MSPLFFKALFSIRNVLVPPISYDRCGTIAAIGPFRTTYLLDWLGTTRPWDTLLDTLLLTQTCLCEPHHSGTDSAVLILRYSQEIGDYPQPKRNRLHAVKVRVRMPYCQRLYATCSVSVPLFYIICRPSDPSFVWHFGMCL